MQESPSADNQQPSFVELAWLAGFIDGEGHFGLNVQTRAIRPGKYRKYKQVAPRCTIVNTNRYTIERLHELLTRMDVGHQIMPNRPTKPSHHVKWAVNIIGYKRLAVFFPQVTRYLITKREQARLMAAFVLYRLRIGRGPYDGVELEVWECLKALNHDEGSTTRDRAHQLIDVMV